MSELSFYELARTSHIKRWTIINTTKEQNLAEHQYNVTVIGLELRRRAGFPVTAEAILELMFHDSPEIRYGDIPTPGKTFIRKHQSTKGGAMDIFRQMDSAIMPDFPFAPSRLPENLSGRAPGERELMKLADLIEAAWWINENGAGHHARIVAGKCWGAVEDWVHECELYDIANPVLMDLGLPFVNKSERLTPP